MEGVFRSIAASMAAGGLTYAALEVTETASLGVRLIAGGVVALVGLAAALALARSERRQHGGTRIGDRIRSRGDVDLQRVEVDGAEGETRVGTRVRAHGRTKISDVKVTRRKDGK